MIEARAAKQREIFFSPLFLTRLLMRNFRPKPGCASVGGTVYIKIYNFLRDFWRVWMIFLLKREAL